MTVPANLLEKTQNPLETTESPKALKVPETPERTEKQPETAESPKPPKNPEPAKTAETSETLKAPETSKTAETPKKAKTPKAQKPPESPSSSTLDLAARDVRLVIDLQREQGQSLTTKLNILFVTNGALLTSLTISRLLFFLSPFSIAEIMGFLLNFTLLINAFLPRQVAVSPNLEDKKFLERYLVLQPQEYQLQMIVNLVETYNANKQRLEDVSSSLKYSAYVTWGIALIIMLHIVSAYFVPVN